MPEPIDCKYRAFLSYAHADRRCAQWLHGRLEGFAIDKDLAGRATALGPVPRTLRPIFRDREDFSGGHTLGDATVAALDHSAALIVLCSKVAATRPAVNEEVRLFRWRHPERPVIPVVVDGKPCSGGTDECFPPALRFEIAADGTITDRPVTLLGPDLRDVGDGRELALAKIVAGLIGVPVEDVRKRQLIADRKAMFRSAAIATGFAVLLVVAGFLWWQHERQQDRAVALTRQMTEERETTRKEMEEQRKQLAALVQRLTLIAPANAGTGDARAVGAAVEAAAEAASRGDVRLQRALDLLSAGNIKDAEALFRAVAEEKSARVNRDKADAAAAWRNLGAIAGLGDPKRAREAYGKALELDADDVEALYWHGYLHYLAGDLATADQSLLRLLPASTSRNDQRGIYRAHLRLGEIEMDRGNLSTAHERQRTAFDIAVRQSSADPGNLEWQRDLSVSHEKIGDLLVDQGNLPAALDAFNASLAITERLAKADPGNAGWQHDVALSLQRVGLMAAQRNDRGAALGHYRRGLEIMQRLVRLAPDHAAFKRDLAWFEARIGELGK